MECEKSISENAMIQYAIEIMIKYGSDWMDALKESMEAYKTFHGKVLYRIEMDKMCDHKGTIEIFTKKVYDEFNKKSNCVK